MQINVSNRRVLLKRHLLRHNDYKYRGRELWVLIKENRLDKREKRTRQGVNKLNTYLFGLGLIRLHIPHAKYPIHHTSSHRRHYIDSQRYPSLVKNWGKIESVNQLPKK
jgi:hypothetical protein